MPINIPAAMAEERNDLDFASVLRDSLVCAVIIVDEHSRVAGFNSKAEALLRLKTANVLGKSIDVLPAALQEFITDALAAADPLPDRQIILPSSNAGKLTVHASLTPVRAATGKIAGLGLVLNDVSSANNWEANLRRLDRLHSVGTLSASMAHEVKNAFVAVKTFVDLLLEKNKETELADVVRAEMSRIDAILSQMRKLSGPVRPNFAEVRLHTVIDRALILIQHLLEEKKIKVSRAFDAPSDLLKGDADQLEQALINLCFNALDAMKPNGRLTVSTELLAAGVKISGLPKAKSQPHLRLTVKDTGSGITPEHMERLFEPFFTTKPDGTGLGLAITRRIVQEHHGAIAVQSEPGKGTTFTITLPAVAR